MLTLSLFLANVCSASTLQQQYTKHCQEWSDIHEHLPVLRQLSSECSSVIEIGVRSGVSTWGILMGLAESPNHPRSYLGIDLDYPPEEKYQLAQALAKQNQISFKFWKGNDLDAEVEPADMIFIDTLHTYCQLTVELEKFGPKAKKYIAMHDTNWGDLDDPVYEGDYSEYPAYVDRTKRGLWQAIVDFLARHPEWQLKEHRLNNYGFTTLERV
jgi:cephalosporin hydroxylase